MYRVGFIEMVAGICTSVDGKIIIEAFQVLIKEYLLHALLIYFHFDFPVGLLIILILVKV